MEASLEEAFLAENELHNLHFLSLTIFCFKLIHSTLLQRQCLLSHPLNSILPWKKCPYALLHNIHRSGNNG